MDKELAGRRLAIHHEASTSGSASVFVSTDNPLQTAWERLFLAEWYLSNQLGSENRFRTTMAILGEVLEVSTASTTSRNEPSPDWRVIHLVATWTLCALLLNHDEETYGGLARAQYRLATYLTPPSQRQRALQDFHGVAGSAAVYLGRDWIR